MCRFLLFSCFIVLCSFLSFSQTRVADFTSKTEKIKFDKDTVWIINTGYDLYHQKFELTLDFTEQTPTPSKIKWDASLSEENVIAPQMTHMYETGLYDLQLTDANTGKIYHYMIFNKMLSADFEISPDPFKFCFEVDGDSLLIIKKNFTQNIPGTEYDIVVEGPAPIEDGVDILCEVSEWFGPQNDSAWVVFKQETGVKPCNVYLKLRYSDENKGIDLVEETNTQKVSVYRAPNVRKIFDFEEPKAEEIKNMEVCTNSHQDYLNLNEDKLNYYQYKKGSSAPIPYYTSYEKAKDFEIHYFYSDTLYDGMPESVWREVTGKADTVSVTADVSFFVAGYYKMMITANNICNEVGGIKIDTLWTDKVSGSEEKRYFQVYSYDDTKIRCKSDTVCMNITDTIMIVDYNSRRGFEVPPVYSFSSEEYDLNTDATITSHIWRDGRIINLPEAENSGCDSTVIYIRLNKYDFYGELNLNMNRETFCGSLEHSFKINVGRKPVVVKEQLYQELAENYGILFDGAFYNHCDTFKYKMPLDSLVLPANTKGFQLDSVYFYIRQGTASEYPLVYRQGDSGELAQWFDSTDVRSCVRIRSFNVCGWAEDSVELRINARPKVELWRDSVSQNDSLCIGLDYPYYWNGKLPKDCNIFLTPSNPVYVNGVPGQGGVQIQMENGDDIRHTLAGAVEEKFYIQNKNMLSCAFDSTWKAEVLALPDTLLHPDSVGYCSGSLELKTIKLFETGKSDFKWGEWKLNRGNVKKEQLPDFSLTGGVDTLRYKLSRSKGCYVQGQLLLRPQTVPQLKLHDEVHYCLPASILSFRKETAIVQDLSDWEGYNRLTVYEDKISPVAVRYQDLSSGPANSNYELDEESDGKQFIYEIENIRVDTALMGKCRLLDSVSLSISAPEVKVLKSDVLVHPWNVYDFAHLETGHFVDTAHIVPSTIKWTLRPEGTSWSGLYGGAYTLQPADKAKDTLRFELSAQSYCGVELKDTLIVELNHLKVKGYKDTICSNEKDYPLWDKVKWSYVDLSSVQWKIVYPLVSPGTITGTTGADVKYTPGDGTDSVRISFEATLQDVPSEKMQDTVVLLINPAPVLKFSKDTLWACNQSVKLRNIPSAYLHSAHTKGIVHGDYILEPGQSRVGGWSGNDYVFGGSLENFEENLSQKVAYEARGLDGCKNAIDTVVLVQPVPVKLEFKREHEEMCTGDRIKLDTLYTLKGMDRFAHFEWSLASNAWGHYEDGHYVASQPEDKIQELSVKTHKAYTCYDGNSSGVVLQTTPVILPLTVHRKPEFNIIHRFDTLCRNNSAITIQRDWVKVKEGNYPDYQDSVRVNGLRLLNDGINYSVNTEGGHEKLVVTVAQGHCAKWKAQSDTIYLYRLPSMLSGSFSIGDVCEGGQSEIDKTNLTINPLATQVKWAATGGFITADNKYFVPDNDIRQAFVRLTANAPHDCGTESLPEVTVNIGRKPQLQIKEYTVCRLAGHNQQIATMVKDPTVQVQKIDWYRCGTTDEYIMTTGISEQEWPFTVSATDVLKPELCLLAKIQCGGACQGIFEDTVRIQWQEKPSFVIQPVTVCQADPVGVDLSAKVQVGNAGLVEWNLQTPAAGSLNGSVFIPGEYSGLAVVNVKAPGLFGCPDEIKPVPVTVNAAPESGIVVSGENCTQRQVQLRPGSKRAQSYDWEFGDATHINDAINPVSHTYQNENTYVISMVAHFANGCARKETKPWLVNLTPQANFILPAFAPIAKPVSLNSTSVPQTVSCKWTIDAASSYAAPVISHIFNAAGSHEVQLVVTSLEGCTDTLAQSTTVLGKPVADFDVVADSCSGIVQIVNKSIRNGATVAWDFGNGQSVADVWQPIDQSYPLVWKDTLYSIRLTLSNISDTVEYTRTFKMISRLEPAFEIWSNTDLCNKTEKEIRILTKGKADTTYVDWGDGAEPDVWLTADQINVLSHTYPENTTTALNSYTIKLRSVNACYHPVPVESAISIVPQQIRVKVMEEDELAAYKNKCYGHERAFWNKSFGFISQGYTCEWDFGDKTSLETDTVSVLPKAHLFERPGSYIVRLRVKDECNERLDSVKIIVHGNDSLDFAFGKDKNRLCTGDSIRLWFVQRGEQPFTDLRWNLPDGTHQQADTIYYKFNEPGKWVVSLKAQADGCPENPLSRSCIVRQTPLPLIDYATAKAEDCTPLKMPFSAVNGKGSTEGMKIYWDFGDGSSSQELFPPVKIYETAGRYVVRLSMTSPEECVAWDSVPVIAKITPEAKLELDQHLVCSPDGNFEVIALNRTVSPEDCSFEWYKDKEAFSMDPGAVTIPFVNFYGKEKISLRAVHKLTQCESRANDSIVASFPVKAGLWVSPDTVCGGMDVIFKDTSTLAGTSRQLVFDDGSIEKEQEVMRTYWEAGKYAYQFVVTNPDGCTDTIRDTVYVNSLPVAEFDWKKDNSVAGIEGTVGTDVENGGVRFTNTSDISLLNWEKEGLYYHWDFGDGHVSGEKEPVHLFANNGSYEVWLHAVSQMGCRDSISHLIDIATIKGLFFPNAMIPASSDPGVNRFQPKGIGLHTFTLKIYAPDGSCVWQTDKLDEGRPSEYWDGTFNGKIVPAGVYNWDASALFIDGSVQNHLNGTLIIIR